MNRQFIENLKVWRLAKIQEKQFSREGRSLTLDVAILHHVFGIAVEFRLEGRPGDRAEHGAQPFSGDQLTKLRQAANEDLLAYLLLRWTGLRGSDAVRLKWDEIGCEAREINRLTQKRKKRVVLPIPQELYFALVAEHGKRMPQPDERILVNPGNRAKGAPMTRPRLYERMLAMVSVPACRTHTRTDTGTASQWTCWRVGRVRTTWQSCSEIQWQPSKSTTPRL